ncbi:PLDc N-terminal domain-containing protein [Methanolobus sp. WCC5]|uniref:PLDc N-terminal domain-containing protein n=1 Tax=Methanolobus sp. WCC5 TaxID=3125785 RepID=UPI003249F7F0
MSVMYDIWGLITLVSVIWVIYDVMTRNDRLEPIKKVLWIIIAIIFGVLGAIAYYFLGKR